MIDAVTLAFYLTAVCSSSVVNIAQARETRVNQCSHYNEPIETASLPPVPVEPPAEETQPAVESEPPEPQQATTPTAPQKKPSLKRKIRSRSAIAAPSSSYKSRADRFCAPKRAVWYKTSTGYRKYRCR